ncbi:MAG: GGDEF domain-containing protein, partial [Clostridiales bacterium]|nr:GGDEF domain-containing protein [Clostridiales bacterium]
MEKEARRPPRWLYGGAVLAVAALSYSAGVVAPVPVPGWRSCRRYWSESDPLTGVLSRRAFTARFQSTLRKALPGTCYALVMLDLDAFKQINDTCGHPCGDQVLCRVTRELRRTLRSDDMVGRLGGDEFIVCLRDIRGNALERRLQEL